MKQQKKQRGDSGLDKLVPKELLLRFPGLSSRELSRARRDQLFTGQRSESQWLSMIRTVAGDPMVLLLLAVGAIYIITDQLDDGFLIILAIVFVAGISAIQNIRTQKAISGLKSGLKPFCKVIRNGKTGEVMLHELVAGDMLIVSEGDMLPADGRIVYAHDLFIDESLLTGESLPVFKDPSAPLCQAFCGTAVVGGMALVQATAVGASTRMAGIEQSLLTLRPEPGKLEREIKRLVRVMVLIGAICLCSIMLISFLRTHNLLDSLLKALTLAMSILPEEIPVAYSFFTALGAWRLLKQGVLIKQLRTMELLGSVSVVCTDKTGTLTENRMTIASVFTPARGIHESFPAGAEEAELLELAMWASEPVPFDPMERALHRQYELLAPADDRSAYSLIHEYPLSGVPPMMTHVFENRAGARIIAAKGAPEALIRICITDEDRRREANAALAEMTRKGYRVLGVARSDFSGNRFPAEQQSLPFRFAGLIGFYDPPRPDIPKVLKAFYKAGIKVCILTGDNPLTTATIASQVQLRSSGGYITGDQVMAMTDQELLEKIGQTRLFTRMFPEAKLRIIRLFKASGEIVAMIGDGVNDAPALKAAHVGIAMGRNGTTAAKEAAAMVLANSDLSMVINAIASGRRVYTNLKSAIRYIISIHTPIIACVLLPALFNWTFYPILLPIHVIFMELIMSVTCSVGMEGREVGAGQAERVLRAGGFMSRKELLTSLGYGILFSALTLLAYRWGIMLQLSEFETRALVFAQLLAVNISLILIYGYTPRLNLTYANTRHLIYPVLVPLGLAVIILGIPGLRDLFKLELPPLYTFVVCALTAILPGLIMVRVRQWLP